MLKIIIVFWLLFSLLTSVLNLLLLIFYKPTEYVSLINLNGICIYFSLLSNLFMYLKVRLLPNVISVSTLFIYTHIICIFYVNNLDYLPHLMFFINNVFGLVISIIYTILFSYNQYIVIKSNKELNNVLSNRESIIRRNKSLRNTPTKISDFSFKNFKSMHRNTPSATFINPEEFKEKLLSPQLPLENNQPLSDEI